MELEEIIGLGSILGIIGIGNFFLNEYRKVNRYHNYRGYDPEENERDLKEDSKKSFSGLLSYYFGRIPRKLAYSDYNSYNPKRKSSGKKRKIKKL